MPREVARALMEEETEAVETERRRGQPVFGQLRICFNEGNIARKNDDYMRTNVDKVRVING